MSNLFPYANVDAESIKAVIGFVPTHAGTTPPPKGLGFSLVKGTLVSNSFLAEVERELERGRLNCFEVTNVTDMFTRHYLDSLTVTETGVLGECVLMLIEQARVPISLIKAKKAA